MASNNAHGLKYGMIFAIGMRCPPTLSPSTLRGRKPLESRDSTVKLGNATLQQKSHVNYFKKTQIKEDGKTFFLFVKEAFNTIASLGDAHKMGYKLTYVGNLLLSLT